MNPIQSFLINFIENPKTTLTGLAGGSASAGAVFLAIQQAGCNFELVHWGAVLAAFMGPTVIGGIGKDGHAPDQRTRASDAPTPPVAKP